MKGRDFMNQPLLSIAIPTFNRSKKLESQLSALHRLISKSSFSDSIELVVVDNCSTDSSQDVIKEFTSLNRDYIFSSYRNERNLGSERNFGLGILRSQGKFTWLLSDDDILHEEAIDHIYQSLNANQEIGFCFVNYFINEEVDSLPAVNIDNKDILAPNISEYIAATMFAESMISACIFRKSLFAEETLTTIKEGPYQFLYWVSDSLQNHSALVIKVPLFTVAHPGVPETRKNANKREDTTDFYLEAHLDFLKYTSYIYGFSLGLFLRLKIYRLTLNENLNQIIYHKITTNGLGYNLPALRLALPVMLRKFYFSLSFWLFHIPLLLLPSNFARFAEPLRWKYLNFRSFFGNIIRKFYNLFR